MTTTAMKNQLPYVAMKPQLMAALFTFEIVLSPHGMKNVPFMVISGMNLREGMEADR